MTNKSVMTFISVNKISVCLSARARISNPVSGGQCHLSLTTSPDTPEGGVLHCPP